MTDHAIHCVADAINLRDAASGLFQRGEIAIGQCGGVKRQPMQRV
jgi:hypothetical protein